MGLLERCDELFKTSSLYEVLGTTKHATEADIRKAYYKVSLRIHPDRAPDDPRATDKFQVLGKVYAVLSDEEQRKVYDEQGIVDEETDALSQVRCWEEYWRALFPQQITVQDIIEFKKKYKGTEEEPSGYSSVLCAIQGGHGRHHGVRSVRLCRRAENLQHHPGCH
uniref:DnaJ homolog subfamily C member 9 n=1 Tax=Periophthalmus magnuspinnatus TaxID=409849 RepID=A0A3B3ZXT7_9GOBI